MAEMIIENRPSITPEKRSSHWYLYANDSFRLNCVDTEGKEYKHVARIPFGATVTIEPAEKKDRIRRIKGANNRFIGRGRIVKIEKEGRKVDSLEIDESSIGQGEKIEIYLPQQHTRVTERRKKTKNFPGQSSLDEEVFKKVS